MLELELEKSGKLELLEEVRKISFGVLGFSRVMKYLFEHHESQVKFLFIGLMLGTLPYVFKEANKKGFKRTYILPCIIAFSMIIIRGISNQIK